MTQPYVFPATRRDFVFPGIGGDMPAGSFVMHPTEHYPVGISMARQLPTGRTLLRATVSATDLTVPADATTTVLARTSATITTPSQATVEVRAGTLEHKYRILYTLYDNLNSMYVESLIMFVKPA